jgi:D-psicose/D-tagatose/L-ribulose 3-epimerase
MTPDERTATFREWRDNLAPVVEHAAERGVRIGIEPLNRYETSLVNTVDQALEALGPLLGPSLGLALDTYHLNIEERSSADAVRRTGAHLVHLQVCGSDRGAPGGDQTDWAALLAALDEIGYDGPLAIESFTPDNAAIAVAASIWRPLAPSPDDLARDGLAFLRSVADPATAGGVR